MPRRGTRTGGDASRAYSILDAQSGRTGRFRGLANQETPAPGCSIAYGSASQDGTPQAAAARLFELAAEYAAEGEADHALGFIAAALRGGYDPPGPLPDRPSPAPDEGRGAEGVEQHVHYEVEAPGFKPRIWRLGFADDPFWTRIGQAPPRWAAEVIRGPDGVDRCEHEIRLEQGQNPRITDPPPR